MTLKKITGVCGHGTQKYNPERVGERKQEKEPSREKDDIIDLNMGEELEYVQPVHTGVQQRVHALEGGLTQV